MMRRVPWCLVLVAGAACDTPRVVVETADARCLACDGGTGTLLDAGIADAARPDANRPRDAGAVDSGMRVCEPGADLGCNHDDVPWPQGTCVEGQCECATQHLRDPFTGRCTAGSTACQARGGECTITETDFGPCPDGTYMPFEGMLSSCNTGVPRTCCIPTGDVGSPCSQDALCATETHCLDEQFGYPPGGLCTHPCLEPADCPSWALCIPVFFSAAPGQCMVPCSGDDTCRDGWSCQAFPQNPFGDSDGATVYVCWATDPSSPLGLGQPCVDDVDCLSQRCRLSAVDGARRCSASCDENTPCLPGYACASGSCFPTPEDGGP